MAPTKDNWTLEIGEDCCFHSGNRVAITTSGEDDGESWDATVAELWPADDDEDIRCGRLIAAAPDLLAACQQITAAHDNGWRILDAISLARNAAAKATGTPAETSAPDDPTQSDLRTAHATLVKDAIDANEHMTKQQGTIAALLEALRAMTANTRAETPEAIAAFDLAERAISRATNGTMSEPAQAIERHIAEAQQDMPLPDLLAAMDNCLDDVIRLAERALLQVNDKVKS